LIYGPFGIQVKIIKNIAPVDKKKKMICAAQPQTVVQDLETLCQLYQ